MKALFETKKGERIIIDMDPETGALEMEIQHGGTTEVFILPEDEAAEFYAQLHILLERHAAERRSQLNWLERILNINIT